MDANKNKLILNKAECIKELDRLQSAIIGQYGRLAVQGLGKDVTIIYCDNPGSCAMIETIADNVFRPALTNALKLYKEKLQAFIDKE